MYVVNVLTALVFGTLSLTWIWSFTDWFATVTAALGLGGILSWAAVVARIIPQRRFDTLSAFIDTRILPSRTFLAVQVVLWGLFLGFLPWSSTAIVLDNSLGRAAARIVIEPVRDPGAKIGKGARAAETAGAIKAHSVAVPVGQKRLVRLDTGLFGSKRYRLRPRGAPDVTIEVAYLESMTLALPDVFYRDHSLLLYPSVVLWQATKRGGPTLRVDRISAICNGAETAINSKKPMNIEDYRGQTVWLGTAKPDIEPPAAVIEELVLGHRTYAKFEADDTDKRSLDWNLRRPQPHPVAECAGGVRKITGFRASLIDPSGGAVICTDPVAPRQSGASGLQMQVLRHCTELQTELQ